MRQETNTLTFTEITTPIGQVMLLKSHLGLCYVEFGTWELSQAKCMRWAKRWYQKVSFECNIWVFQREVQEIFEYFHGERQTFSFQIDLRGTSFQRKVWQALMQLPYGTTASYRDIALAIDAPTSMRAVGAANHRNPLPIVIPCHRVISAKGQCIGFNGGVAIQQALLQIENQHTEDKDICQSKPLML